MHLFFMPVLAWSEYWPLYVVIASVAIFFSIIMFFASRYKRCPSDRILVVYGRTKKGQFARCIHGGGAFIWPLIQDCSFLNLTPITTNIPLENALSLQNIRINVPSTFTVGISTQPGIMNNAAERLLGLRTNAIEEMVREIIFGQLRLTVASLTIEQINTDRESFLESIRQNVEPELNKIGLYLINVNITDITDESAYIEALGKKAASEAINKARVDVAEQEKSGAIGEAEANKVKEVQVAQNQAGSAKGQKEAEADRRIFVHTQEATAIKGENEAKANIADYEAGLAVKRAEANKLGEVAKRQAEVEIQQAEYRAEQERLKAAEIVRQEIDKTKKEIAAEAEAEKTRREARGHADAIFMKYEADAEGIRKVLENKASGYEALVKSCNGDAKAVATLLMIEKLEEIVGKQVEAISNLKIDKVTVWDSAGGNEKGSSTANFLSSMIKSLPPIQDVANMAGVELPSYLGKVIEENKESDAGSTADAPAKKKPGKK